MNLNEWLAKYDEGEKVKSFRVMSASIQELIVETIRKLQQYKIPESPSHTVFLVSQEMENVIYKANNSLSRKYFFRENETSEAKEIIVLFWEANNSTDGFESAFKDKDIITIQNDKGRIKFGEVEDES